MHIVELKDEILTLSKTDLDDKQKILKVLKKIKNDKYANDDVIKILYDNLNIRLIYDKDFIFQSLCLHHEIIKYIPFELRFDKDIVFECIKNGGTPESAINPSITAIFNLDQYDEEIREHQKKLKPLFKNKEFLLNCIKYNPYYIKFADDDTLNDDYFMRRCFLDYPIIINVLSENIRNKLINLIFTLEDPPNLSFLGEFHPYREKIIRYYFSKKSKKINNMFITTDEIYKYEMHLYYDNEFIEYIKANSEFRKSEVEEIIKDIRYKEKYLEIWFLKLYSENYDIMLNLLSYRGLQYSHIVSQQLFSNYDFIMDVIKISDEMDMYGILEDISEEKAFDINIILIFLDNGLSLLNLISFFEENEKILKYAKKNNININSFLNKIYNNQKIILNYIKDEFRLYYIFLIHDKLPYSMKNNKKIIIEILKSIENIKHNEDLKWDEISEFNDFIKKLNTNLKDDFDIAKLSVKISPFSLEEFSPKIQDNRYILREAYKSDASVFNIFTLKRKILFYLFG